MHFPHHGTSYGITTIGARGQIVIPAQAREDLKLKEGDRLLVFSRHGRFLGLVKSQEIDDIIDKIASKLSKGAEELKKWKTSLKSKI